MLEATARRHLATETPSQPALQRRQRTHRPVCAKCMRPLDIWPDGTVLHQDARFDLAVFPEHHEPVELP
jgi:hypothetical protein